MLTEWSCARRLPWNIGTKGESQNPLSEDAHGLKRKSELFLFEFFIIHFLLLHGSVCFKRSHRANNGKQRTTLLAAELPLMKESSSLCQIRLKLVIIIKIRLKRAKEQTPINFFRSELAC